MSALRWRRPCSRPAVLLFLLFLLTLHVPALPAQWATSLRTRARLLRIEDTRRDEPAFLDSALLSSSAVLRARAALTAGRLGAATHRPLLRRLGDDVAPRVAATALFALGLVKDTASAPIAERALHREDAVAVEGAWLLGEIGARGAPAIIAGLTDTAISPPTRGALLLAAARVRPLPTAAIARWLDSPESAIVWRAAYALARGRSSAGARSLLARAGSPWSSVREQVARGLGWTVTGDSLGEAALAVLARLARDADARVRVNAVRASATYGPRGRAAVTTALLDPNVGVRLVAAQSLDAVLAPVPSEWPAADRIDSTFVIQHAIAVAMAKLGLPVPVADTWRTSREWRRRAAYVQLGAFGPASEALGRVLIGLRDPDGRVRAVAAGAVATLAESATVRERARGTLRSSLDDPDVSVRAAALGGLSAGASLQDLGLAIEPYRRAAVDGDSDARLGFWQLADSALRAGGGPDSLLARQLGTLPRPRDALERIAASRIARFAAWADSTSPLHPIAWYEARAREAASSRPLLARIETERGTMDIELYASDAPLTVYNFITLARRRYFDSRTFHRVVPNFVVQSGDPRGDGNGGPGYAIRDELNQRRYQRGTLGMALSGPNTGGSQFFVTHAPQPHLDGGYTVFGGLRSGADVLDRITQGDRLVRITIH